MAIKMVERDCPICGNRDQSLVFAEANFNLGQLDEFAFASRKLPEYMHHRLVECPECGVLYASPMLPPKKIAAAYAGAAFGSQEEAGYAARTYGGFLPKIAGKLPDREGALDIGTGDGAFLEELLRHGFTKVRGIEPSQAPVKAAKEEIRPLIKNGLFNPRDCRLNSLSLVTSFQTFEHLVDPMETAREVYKILKPGGAFFIISHNRDALSAKVLGKKSPIFDIEHLQLFSFKSAKAMMEKAGLSGVSARVVWNIYPIQYWLKLLPVPFKARILDWLKKTGIGKWPVPLPAGNMAVIGFKPTTKAN